MKIAPLIRPPPPPPPPAPAAPPSTQSFRDLLAGSEAGRDGQERAFGFCELGMFGADGAAAYRPEFTAEQATALSPTQFAGVLPVGADGSPAAVTAPAQPSLTVMGAGPGAPSSSAAGAASLRVTVRGDAAPAPQDSPFTPARLAGPSARRDAPARSAAPDQPPRRPANPNALSLLFTDRNGPAQLVAAAGGLNAEGRAALRKAAVAVLAEFGLDLGDLTLNGEAVEPFTITQPGAFDGDSTR